MAGVGSRVGSGTSRALEGPLPVRVPTRENQKRSGTNDRPNNADHSTSVAASRSLRNRSAASHLSAWWCC